MRGHCAATLCYVKPSNIDQPRKNNVVYKRAFTTRSCFKNKLVK
uniref:Uncharacterized protein n=1 Tax=Anguilla anguilla TaxID=7936 RepID=A0A0E9R4L6_ANGAN